MRRFKLYKIVCYICICTGIILILIINGLAQTGTWTTLTNTNFIQDIVVEGDTFWVASTGGVLLFDFQSKEYVQTFSNVDGLSHIIVTSISIDRNGDVWFATDGGGVSKLNRPEYTWRTYGVFDGITLHINTQKQDGKNLWIGTDEGISLFQWGWDWDERDTTYVWKENYDSRNGLPSDIILSLVTDDSTIWVGTEAGVCMAMKDQNLKDPQSWTVFTAAHGLPSIEILSLVIEQSRIYVGTGDGVVVLDEQSWIDAGLSGNRIYSLRLIDGILWAGTSNGVFRFQNDQWLTVDQQGLPTRDIRALCHQEDNTIVGGTWGNGVVVFDGSVWSSFETGGPWRNSFGNVLVDGNGYVWCSTFEGLWTSKLSRYDDEHWTIFDDSDGMETGSGIVSMLSDSRGNKWFGTWGDGISQLDDKGTLEKDDDEWTVFNSRNSPLPGIPEDPTYEVIPSIQQDRTGTMWIAAFGIGIVAYSSDNNLWETYTPTDGLVDRLTRSLAIDSDEGVWVGAEQNGVNRLNTSGTPFIKTDDSWLTFDADDGFTNSTVNSILSDDQGTMWFATSEGLYRYTDASFSRDNHIQNSSVLSLGMDAVSNVWVGTSNQGVFVFDHAKNLKWHFDRTNSGLVDVEVKSIAFNEETGEAWFATPIGLSRYESGIIRPKVESGGVLIYPNPFLISQTVGSLVTFAPVTGEASVKIFTVSGELIAELAVNERSWDGRNTSGQLVGSGIYFVVVTGPGMNPRMGKLAIMR